MGLPPARGGGTATAGRISGKGFLLTPTADLLTLVVRGSVWKAVLRRLPHVAGSHDGSVAVRGRAWRRRCQLAWPSMAAAEDPRLRQPLGGMCTA